MSDGDIPLSETTLRVARGRSNWLLKNRTPRSKNRPQTLPF